MEEIRAADQGTKAMANSEGKYLTFSLAGEEYGTGVRKVKEIVGIMQITPVPQTPHYMKGVINLRGKVIPIVELRLKFGMAAVDYTEKTCIIVVEVVNNNRNVLIGMLVDSVSEVLNIKEADIEETRQSPQYELHFGDGKIRREGEDPPGYRQGTDKRGDGSNRKSGIKI